MWGPVIQTWIGHWLYLWEVLWGRRTPCIGVNSFCWSFLFKEITVVDWHKIWGATYILRVCYRMFHDCLRDRCREHRKMQLLTAPCHFSLEAWCSLGFSSCPNVSTIPWPFHSEFTGMETRGSLWCSWLVSLSHINETCFRTAKLKDMMRLHGMKAKLGI